MSTKEIKLITDEIDYVPVADSDCEDEGTAWCDNCGVTYWSTANLPGGCSYENEYYDIVTDSEFFCCGDCFINAMLNKNSSDEFINSDFLDKNIESSFYQMSLNNQKEIISKFKEKFGNSSLITLMEEKHTMFFHKYSKKA